MSSGRKVCRWNFVLWWHRSRTLINTLRIVDRFFEGARTQRLVEGYLFCAVHSFYDFSLIYIRRGIGERLTRAWVSLALNSPSTTLGLHPRPTSVRTFSANLSSGEQQIGPENDWPSYSADDMGKERWPGQSLRASHSVMVRGRGQSWEKLREEIFQPYIPRCELPEEGIPKYGYQVNSQKKGR